MRPNQLTVFVAVVFVTLAVLSVLTGPGLYSHFLAYVTLLVWVPCLLFAWWHR